MTDKIVISADCVCDLPEALIEKYSISILPFYIEMNGARFLDSTEVDFASAYEYMKEDNVKVSSASASMEDYKNYFEKLAERTKATIIHICVSGKQSSAYERALTASRAMEQVYVVDSELISLGTGLLVLKAAELVQSGVTAVEQILFELETAKDSISCSFILKSMQPIANNKRMNQLLSNLLDIFRIKPIIKVKGNAYKVRGVSLSNNSEVYVKKYVRKILRKRKNISEDILFITVMSSSESFRDFVYKEATKRMTWKQVYVQDASATNLCNIGIGSVGMMFYIK